MNVTQVGREAYNSRTACDNCYIVEKMRQDPETRALVKAQLDAWDALCACAQ